MRKLEQAPQLEAEERAQREKDAALKDKSQARKEIERQAAVLNSQAAILAKAGRYEQAAALMNQAETLLAQSVGVESDPELEGAIRSGIIPESGVPLDAKEQRSVSRAVESVGESIVDQLSGLTLKSPAHKLAAARSDIEAGVLKLADELERSGKMTADDALDSARKSVMETVRSSGVPDDVADFLLDAAVSIENDDILREAALREVQRAEALRQIGGMTPPTWTGGMGQYAR
jgi:hypothetical protein